MRGVCVGSHHSGRTGSARACGRADRALVARQSTARPARQHRHHHLAVVSPSSARVGGVACGVASGERTDQPVSDDAVSDFGETLDVVVVGAGITGLCAAQALRTDGVDKLLVTETRDEVGGNIITRNERGYIWEEGPNSFQPNDFVLKAAVDAGVADELVFGDPTAARYVFWEGELRKVPSSPDTAVFGTLLSPWGKVRAGLGAVGIKSPAPEGVEESVEQFIRRNLGDEVFYRLIEPFCSGVYAGDPTKLSMKAAFGKIHVLEEKGGSLVGGALKLMQEKKDNPPPARDPSLPTPPKGQTVGSFREGLQTLPRAIARGLGDAVRTSWTLRDVDRVGTEYALSFDTPEGPTRVKAKAVVMTVPSYTAAELLRREIPDAHSQLLSFFYPPVGSVVLSYPREAIRDSMFGEDGRMNAFGELHPRTQGVTTLGTIYSSSLFPGRCPDGEVLLSSYIGGTLNQGILDQSEDELAAQVDKDLRKMLLKPDAPAPTVVGVRTWQKAIPQFGKGHLDALDAANAAVEDAGYEGFFLSGNFKSGVALGKCVEGAYEIAGTVSGYLKDVASAEAAAGGAAAEAGKDDFFV